jgi:DNA-binding transcriptional MocR family regulator
LLCERHGVPVVEDGFKEEMKYTGRGVLPLKSMDSRGVVFYAGTFSTVVFPGLRVGWIVAPKPAVSLLTNILQVSSVAGNTLAQAAAARFCAGGEFEAYLRGIHRVYRRRMRVLLEELDEHMPAGVTWTRPRGGYTTWLTLPAGEAPEDELVARPRRVCGSQRGDTTSGNRPRRPNFGSPLRAWSSNTSHERRGNLFRAGSV